MKKIVILCSLVSYSFLVASLSTAPFVLRTIEDAVVIDVIYAAVTKNTTSPALSYIDVKSSYGMSALCLMVLNDKLSEVKFLLEHGANVDAVACNQYSALLLAVARSNYFIADLLLSYGANPYITDSQGKTAREIAEAGEDVAVVSLLERYEQRYCLRTTFEPKEIERQLRKRRCHE